MAGLEVVLQLSGAVGNRGGRFGVVVQRGHVVATPLSNDSEGGEMTKTTRESRRRRCRRALLHSTAAVAAVVAFGVGAVSAQAAISLTRAELKGTQLRVEGSGALPNHTVVVDPGSVAGTSDSAGAFRIESASY